MIYVYYLCGPEHAAIITLMHNARDHVGEKQEKGKKPIYNGGFSIWKHTIPENLIIGVPTSFLILWMFYNALCLLQPHLDLWLFSLLPESHKTGLPFVALFLYESYTLMMSAGAAYVCAYSTLSALPWLKCDVLGSIANKLKAIKDKNISVGDMNAVCAELRLAHIVIHMYNYVFAGFNYVVKIALMFIAIVGLFSGMKSLGEQALTTATSFSFGIEAMVMFVFIFGKMYEVPETLDSIKQTFRVMSQRKMSPASVYTKGFLRSIPKCAVKAGHFYDLDRMSTPTFLDFVANQVVSLLLTV
ncbi:unnamed protein product [Allacma fusca]|uniref:Odorant receptor n=1 Tax=Allacma fusca TaxID=39272 RepID=A0A8J2L223_9HEXA|nr:unnamed protein product [Allacma fusca]